MIWDHGDEFFFIIFGVYCISFVFSTSRYKSPFTPVVRIELRASFNIFYTYPYFYLEREIIESRKNIYPEVPRSPP